MSHLLRAVVALTTTIALATACGGSDSTAGGASGNPSGVGNSCTRNEDCATKNCYLGKGGGYCTTTCSDEGSSAECPLDTVCKPIQGGARRCLLVCGSASACRETTCAKDYCPSGSACVSVSQTTAKACEPEPG